MKVQNTKLAEHNYLSKALL